MRKEKGHEEGGIQETENEIQAETGRRRIVHGVGIRNINLGVGTDPGVEIKRINLGVEVKEEAEDENIRPEVDLVVTTERRNVIGPEAVVTTGKRLGAVTALVLGAARNGRGIEAEMDGRINLDENVREATAVQIPIKTGRVKMEITIAKPCSQRLFFCCS